MAVGIVASLTIASARRKGGLGRFMTRHQAVHLWLLVLFFGHSQRHLSQAAALRDDGRHGVDVAMLVLHYALWFALPSVLLGVPLATALLVYLVPATLLGPYLAAIFWVNHVGMPLVEEPERFSFLEHQALTSRTLTGPPALDWLFGGLNYQIEHHLFPQVPARRLPALRAVVRSHFAAHGVPYNGMTWRAAAGAVAAHLRHVARAA